MTPATLTRIDFGIGTVIALLMAGVFTWIGGQALVSTFVPGLLVTWAIFLWMHLKQVALPDGHGLYPLYFSVLAWQLLHFSEEFMTGFRVQFPALFGGSPFSTELFVGINMVSYFLFVMAFIGAFAGGRRFLLVPVLFFVVYGALGNAIAHTYWVIDQGGYFPGFFTAQLYWVLGILLVARIGGSWRMAVTATCGLGVLLVGVLAMTMQAA
ncbi:hypothetical protein EKE94_01625 [Mesobaculum littorinae]|uniref:HXXEE domain-containing protein n=1 Tax=Mesobaculum littorinae TaxID=2486419 RepID=A0A438ALB0_9RHOB|nr:hypothetical protein [Mesobaculum littorinae]RVV99414.1 hypothetical protein EKE94_01625 [Mesobaculum littorinae]